MQVWSFTRLSFTPFELLHCRSNLNSDRAIIMVITSKSILLCAVPSRAHTHKHTLLALLCSILCLHLLSRISPMQLSLCSQLDRDTSTVCWAWRRCPPDRLPPRSVSVSPSSPPWTSFIGRLGRVVLLWLRFGQILTSWNRTLTQRVLFRVKMCWTLKCSE